MHTILEELASGRVFCDQAGVRQFACFAEGGVDRGQLNSLLFLSWSGFWEPLRYPSYGDEDYDSYSQ